MEAITLNNLAIGHFAPPFFRYGADPQNKGYGA